MTETYRDQITLNRKWTAWKVVSLALQEVQDAEPIPEVGTPGPESHALWNLGPIQQAEVEQTPEPCVLG